MFLPTSSSLPPSSSSRVVLPDLMACHTFGGSLNVGQWSCGLTGHLWEPREKACACFLGRGARSLLGASLRQDWRKYFSCLPGLFRKLEIAGSRLAPGSAHLLQEETVSESVEDWCFFHREEHQLTPPPPPTGLLLNEERREDKFPSVCDPLSGCAPSNSLRL